MESYISSSEYDIDASQRFPAGGPITLSESISAAPSMSSSDGLYSTGPVITSGPILSPVSSAVSPSQTLPQSGPTITPRESAPAVVSTIKTSESFSDVSYSSDYDDYDYRGSFTLVDPIVSASESFLIVDSTISALSPSAPATSSAAVPLSPGLIESQPTINSALPNASLPPTGLPTSSDGTSASFVVFSSTHANNNESHPANSPATTISETVPIRGASTTTGTSLDMASPSPVNLSSPSLGGSLAMSSSASMSGHFVSPSDLPSSPAAGLSLPAPTESSHTSSLLAPGHIDMSSGSFTGRSSSPVSTLGQPHPYAQASASLSGSASGLIHTSGPHNGGPSQPQASAQASGFQSGPFEGHSGPAPGLIQPSTTHNGRPSQPQISAQALGYSSDLSEGQSGSSQGGQEHGAYEYGSETTEPILTTSTIYSTMSYTVTSAQSTKVVTSVVAVSTTIRPVESTSGTKQSGDTPAISSDSVYDQAEGEKETAPSAGGKPSGFTSLASTMSTVNGPRKTTPVSSMSTPVAPINANTPTGLTHAACIPTTTTVYVYATAGPELSKRGLEKRDMGNFDYTYPNAPIVTSTTHTETMTTTVTPSPSGTTTTTNWVYATTTSIIIPSPSGTTTTTLDPSGTYTAWTTTTLDPTLSIYTDYEEATTSTTSTPTIGVATLTEYDTATVTATLTFTEIASETVVTTITACWPEGAYDDYSLPSDAAVASSSSAAFSSSAPEAASSSAAPMP